MALATLAGTRWAGTCELWLDPPGDTALRSPCTVTVGADAVSYEWVHEGRPQQGRLDLSAGGGAFTDTFHSPVAMPMTAVAPARALVDLAGTYAAGDGPPWGWRITLALRPSWDGAPEALVLQMTNVAPWGEEARAVRMVSARQ
ncbi:MAG: hypothetical protein AB7U83_09745 [Vicinamibacterales bacterium]